MHNLQTGLALEDILSRAPGNPVLWHLFLAELARTMQCDSSFLSILGFGRDRKVHYLYHYNVAPERMPFLEQSLRNAASYETSEANQPHKIFYANTQNAASGEDIGGIEPDVLAEHGGFGVSFSLNRHYTYCMYLTAGCRFVEKELRGHVCRLRALVPQLQNALQKEKWLNLYSQITLLTGKQIVAYVVIDRSLNVLFSDPIFNRIIEGMDCFPIQGKRLAFLNKTTEKHVLELMAEIDCNKATMQIEYASSHVMVIPACALDNLYAWEFYDKGAVLAFSSCHENNVTLARLMELYKLTKCEALCALKFIATPSINEIAGGSHRSTETVRNHIKSIMQKLDVHNQGALMKKLLAIAAL